jgi:hypothetical protein
MQDGPLVLLEATCCGILLEQPQRANAAAKQLPLHIAASSVQLTAIQTGQAEWPRFLVVSVSLAISWKDWWPDAEMSVPVTVSPAGSAWTWISRRTHLVSGRRSQLEAGWHPTSVSGSSVFHISETQQREQPQGDRPACSLPLW